MTRKSDPPTTAGMTLAEAKALLARSESRDVVAIGEPSEENLDVTRAIQAPELGPDGDDDDDGNTLPRGEEVAKLLPADIEGPTVQRTVVLGNPSPALAAPVSPSLVDEDAVPVTEGTALLPRNFLMKNLGVDTGELENILSGSPPEPRSESAKPEPVSLEPAKPEPVKSEPVRIVEPAKRGSPWLVGLIVFLISLIVLGGAAFAFIWRHQI